MYIDPNTGYLIQSTVTLGARGDSFYEYLLKQFLLLGDKKSDKCVARARNVMMTTVTLKPCVGSYGWFNVVNFTMRFVAGSGC